MYNVLILAHDFPPHISVGSLRPDSWFKAFKKHGLYPIVVTRQWNDDKGFTVKNEGSKDAVFEKNEYGLIIKTPFKPNVATKLYTKYGNRRYVILRKVIVAFFEFFQYYFTIGPKANIYKGAKAYLTHNKVDFIIATGEPFVLFKYADKLSRKFNVQWVADYRDTWSQSKSRNPNKLIQLFNKKQEKRTVKTAAFVTTVSELLVTQLRENIQNQPIEIIRNGYNQDAIKNMHQISQNKGYFSIGLAGSIYPSHPIKLFFEACNAFIQNQKDIKFHLNLFGLNQSRKIENLINEFYPKLIKHVVFYERMPYEKLLHALAKQNMLLLFNTYASVGTKIFDYIAVNRKILFCFKNDKEAKILFDKEKRLDINTNIKQLPQIDILQKTNTGIIVQDKKHLTNILTQHYVIHQKNGNIACDGLNTEQYSRQVQAKVLALLIKKSVITNLDHSENKER